MARNKVRKGDSDRLKPGSKVESFQHYQAQNASAAPAAWPGEENSNGPSDLGGNLREVADLPLGVWRRGWRGINITGASNSQSQSGPRPCEYAVLRIRRGRRASFTGSLYMIVLRQRRVAAFL